MRVKVPVRTRASAARVVRMMMRRPLFAVFLSFSFPFLSFSLTDCVCLTLSVCKSRQRVSLAERESVDSTWHTAAAVLQSRKLAAAVQAQKKVFVVAVEKERKGKERKHVAIRVRRVVVVERLTCR